MPVTVTVTDSESGARQWLGPGHGTACDGLLVDGGECSCGTLLPHVKVSAGEHLAPGFSQWCLALAA